DAGAAPADRQQGVHPHESNVGRTELLVRGAVDLATEGEVQDVHAVADPEHRRRAGSQELQNLRGRHRGVVGIDAGRTTRQDDALRLEPADGVEPDVERMDLAVHVQLADPTGDQLRVLRAEVEDQDHYSSR